MPSGVPSADRHAATLARLRWRLSRRRPAREIAVEIAGAPQGFVVYAPQSPEAVLDDTARDYARRPATATWFMPYWATPWASGIAAAEAVVADPAPFSSRRVIELGCGLGITAMALAEVGARLVLVDVWPESLAFARFNAVRQGGPGAQVRPLLADWRTAAGADLLLRSGPFDAVVAADVLYEADDVAPLFDLVPRLVRPGGVAWLAEPGRTTSRLFVDAAREAGWVSDVTSLTRDPWPAEAGRGTVRVHRYTSMPILTRGRDDGVGSTPVVMG
jgi:predicted nicotinamide N-methyase